MKLLNLICILFLITLTACKGSGGSSGSEQTNKADVVNENTTTLAQNLQVSTLAVPAIIFPSKGQELDSKTTSVTVKWTSVYTKFLIRAQDLTDLNLRLPKNSSDTHYLYQDNYTNKEVTFEVKAGHSYKFWIHAVSPKKASDYSGSTQVLFSVKPAKAPCGSIAHGKSDSRVMFKEASVTKPASCLSQTQLRECTNGDFSEWSGNYTSAKCEVKEAVIGIPAVSAPVIKGNNVKISWSEVTTNKGYLVRLKKDSKTSYEFYNDAYSGLNLEKTLTPGTYEFWIHAKGPNFTNSPMAGYGEKALINFVVKEIKEDDPVVCAAVMESKSCVIANGVGQQTKTSSCGVFSACTLISCNTGFHASQNTCVADVIKDIQTAFKVGDKVQTTVTTNVRRSAEILSTNLLGSQIPAAVGTIISGPSKSSDGIIWWLLDYDNGVDGFSGENNLKMAEVGSCDGVANGDSDSRTMFKSDSVSSGQQCVSETQKRLCDNGKWTAWSGSYVNSSCSPPAGLCKSITQFGITWEFDKNYDCGKFVNGDNWVIGPVKIIEISPLPSNGRNGFMINPALALSGGVQSYDNRTRYKQYVAPPSLPRVVDVGSSLVSSVSRAEGSLKGDVSAMDTIAVLTILNSAPAPGSFRPPLLGVDKTIRWNESQLDYSKLGSVPVVGGAISLEGAARVFERPWLESDFTWTGRYMHPFQNQPGDGREGYGREIGYAANRSLLMLQFNYSNAAKRKLLINAVQAGIDIYGAAVLGANWISDGGQNLGRKIPLFVAAVVLNDQKMLHFADAAKSFIFQEDQQVFYITQNDVGRALVACAKDAAGNIIKTAACDAGRPHTPYLQTDVGLPEWGIRHNRQPNLDGRDWTADTQTTSYYRRVAGSTFVGAAMVAHLMNATHLWNSKTPVFFDYVDRYVKVEEGFGNIAKGTNSIQAIDYNVYKAYRKK